MPSGPGCSTAQRSRAAATALRDSLGWRTAACLCRLPLPGRPLGAVAGYEDGSLAVWSEGDASHPLVSSRVHADPVMALAVGAPGATAGGRDAAGSRGPSFVIGGLSGSADESMVMWAVELGSDGGPGLQVLQRFHMEGGKGGSADTRGADKRGVADVAVRADGRLAAVGAWDGRVRLYHYSRRRALAVLKYHSKAVTCVCFQPNTGLLASASRDCTIAMWSIY